MAKRPPDEPSTALALRPQTSLTAARAAPPAPLQRAAPALLAASVAAFGDVVQALLSDLDTVSGDAAALGWLAGTGLGLEGEINYQAAVAQLAWWDGFLAELPSPTLLSEARAPEIRRLKALHIRAHLLSAEEAREAHRQLVAEELEAEPHRATQLMRIARDPQPGEWRVDPQQFLARHLEALPPLPDEPPIGAADLDAVRSFSGFNAVNRMRAHPELGPRAAAMDAAVSAALVEHLGLDRAQAAAHAGALTGIFLIALRRALGQGSHQIAVAIRLLADAQQAPIQQQFASELLESWTTYLTAIEVPEPRSGLLGRLLGRKETPALTGEERRLLTDGGEPQGGWSKIKAAFRRRS